MNNTETGESTSPTEVSRTSIPISSALIPGITIPPQGPATTIRFNSDVFNKPNTSLYCTSHEIPSDVTSQQFHIQNTARLPFSHFIKTQTNIPMYHPFTDYFNRIHNNQTAANQPNKSKGQISMINPETTTVPTLSSSSVAALSIADTYSLSSTNNNPFQTITDLSAPGNQCQMLYQPQTPPNTSPSSVLPSSSSTVNPITFPSVNTQTYTVPSIKMKKSVIDLMEVTVKILLKNNYIKRMHSWFLLRENNVSML